MSTHSIQPYSLTVNFFLFIICFSSCKNHSAAELPAAISKGAPAKGDNFLVFKKVSGAADSPINRFQPSLPIVNVLKNDYPLAGKYRLQGMISTKGPGEIQLDSTGIHIVLQVNTHEGMKLMNVDHVLADRASTSFVYRTRRILIETGFTPATAQATRNVPP